MTLQTQFEAQGEVLFRWRSFVPLAILPVALFAAVTSPYFDDGPAGGISLVCDLACILVSFLGLGLRAYTVATAAPRTSGRNTNEQRAESLNTTGIYSVVRNPLYLANYITFLGMLLFIREGWLVAVATLAYIMYYERIVMAEEKFLLAKFGSVYAQWADRTPPMLPRFSQWIPAERSFQLKTALRREYNGFYLIVVSFYLLEWCDRLLFCASQSRAMTMVQAPGYCWTTFLVTGSVVFLVLRTLKKHTSLLDDAQ